MSINSFPGRASQESQESIERIKTALITGLERAFVVHETLGQGGEETVEKNQFGDTALKADIECERAIIDYFREIGLSIRIISEEHGVTNLGEHPEYLGILDGLDGSSVYKRERGVGRYGTMFAVLKGMKVIKKEKDTKVEGTTTSEKSPLTASKDAERTED